MKIAVMGIGGVGGYFGGKLAKYYAGHNDVEITFVARGKHLEEINNAGLKVVADEGSFIARPDKAIDNPAGHGFFDLLIFCVKSYDLEESARLFINSANEHTVAITLLNGVNNRERLKFFLPHIQVLDGCVYIGASIEKAGVVRQAGGACKLFFGSETANDQCMGIEKILRDAGIEAEHRNDIKKVVWEKYMFVSPLASATSFYQKTFGEIMAADESKNLLLGLMKEVESISKFQHVYLPDDICQRSIDKIGLFPYEAKSSLQLDFEKKKKTELDLFTGYIVTYAKKYDLDVPFHEKVYKILLDRS